MSFLGIFAKKHGSFYVLCFLETSPFWDNYWRWEARILYVASQYTYLKKWCRIFSNFHFLAVFGAVNMVRGVNWSKFHGFRPIMTKKIKITKNPAPLFFQLPQGTYIPNFSPTRYVVAERLGNLCFFLMYKMNQVPNIPEIPIYKLYIRYRFALRRPSRKWPELCEKLIFFYTLKRFWKKRSMAIR